MEEIKMDKKEYVLVKEMYDNDPEYILAETKEVEKVVELDYNFFTLDKELTEKEVELVNNRWIELVNNDELDYYTYDTYEIINNIFEETFIDNKAHPMPDRIEIDDETTIGNIMNGCFEVEKLSDYEDVAVYIFEYNDSHNWVKKYVEDTTDSITFKEGDITWESLDEWDGRNWAFGGDHCHAEIGQLNNQWLIKTWSNYAGTLTYIEVCETIDEVRRWFIDNDWEDKGEKLIQDNNWDNEEILKD
jgi:hypothetical protein